jgi:hypothetical protein
MAEVGSVGRSVDAGGPSEGTSSQLQKLLEKSPRDFAVESTITKSADRSRRAIKSLAAF